MLSATAASVVLFDVGWPVCSIGGSLEVDGDRDLGGDRDLDGAGRLRGEGDSERSLAGCVRLLLGRDGGERSLREGLGIFCNEKKYDLIA